MALVVFGPRYPGFPESTACAAGDHFECDTTWNLERYPALNRQPCGCACHPAPSDASQRPVEGTNQDGISEASEP